MKLFYSGASPFVRKVLVVAMETGLDKKIENVATAPVNPTQVNADLSASNPLQKVPALVTDGGEVLFDSSVICEYLDSLHDGRKLFPPAGGMRWRALTLMALADGIVDAGIIRRYEDLYRPPEKRSAEWVAGQERKVKQGLDSLEKSADEFGSQFGIGEIAVACAIGWLEFRKPIGDNRAGRPKLFQWFDTISARPSLAATMPKA
jgi:glutathione S-transferase